MSLPTRIKALWHNLSHSARADRDLDDEIRGYVGQLELRVLHQERLALDVAAGDRKVAVIDAQRADPRGARLGEDGDRQLDAREAQDGFLHGAAARRRGVHRLEARVAIAQPSLHLFEERQHRRTLDATDARIVNDDVAREHPPQRGDIARDHAAEIRAGGARREVVVAHFG